MAFDRAQKHQRKFVSSDNQFPGIQEKTKLVLGRKEGWENSSAAQFDTMQITIEEAQIHRPKGHWRHSHVPLCNDKGKPYLTKHKAVKKKKINKQE